MGWQNVCQHLGWVLTVNVDNTDLWLKPISLSKGLPPLGAHATATFIRWTGCTITTVVPWRQHRKRTNIVTTITNTIIITHALVGGSKLQYLSNGAKITSLVVSQALDNSDINYIKCVRSHNSRVDVTIVD